MNMKRIAGLSLLLLTVSACSTTAAPPSGNQVASTLSDPDRYQLMVEDQARLNGVEVHWVHVPDENDLVKYGLSGNDSDPSQRSN